MVDLKPGNVLVDSGGQVKLLDFGITKALDPLESAGDNNTVGGVRPCTSNYASPEQVRGEPVTTATATATDIDSLGVLQYQMLTGTRPTGRHATTPAEAARSVLEDLPTRPSQVLPGQLPGDTSGDTSRDTSGTAPAQAVNPQWLRTRKRLAGDLDNILPKALEKPTAQRHRGLDTLAHDVRAFLAGHSVSARAASPAYLARQPGAAQAISRLASVEGRLGTVLGGRSGASNLGRLTDTLPQLRRTVALQEPLAQREPANVPWPMAAWAGLGRQLERPGRTVGWPAGRGPRLGRQDCGLPGRRCLPRTGQPAPAVPNRCGAGTCWPWPAWARVMRPAAWPCSTPPPPTSSAPWPPSRATGQCSATCTCCRLPAPAPW